MTIEKLAVIGGGMFAAMVIFNRIAASITGFENAVWQLSASFASDGSPSPRP